MSQTKARQALDKASEAADRARMLAAKSSDLVAVAELWLVIAHEELDFPATPRQGPQDC